MAMPAPALPTTDQSAPLLTRTPACLPASATLQNVDGEKAQAAADLAEERQKSKAFRATAEEVGGWWLLPEAQSTGWRVALSAL